MGEQEAHRGPLRVLRGAMVVFALLGAGLIAWLTDKALRHPEIQAAQAGSTAPLWIPMIVFVAVCTGFLIYVMHRASRRVQAGEDLFRQRHRRRPGTEESAPGT